MINLLNFNRASLRDFFVALGEKPFRADQMLKWIYHEYLTDFSQMNNLSQKLRDYLSENTIVEAPKIVKEQVSTDGVIKWLLQLDDGELIETVFIPEKTRGTLCISSQVGCAMGCKFCATGKLGFKRNLTTAEIIGQVWLVRQLQHKVTNVVLMGMGEPLLNVDHVLPALDLMLEDLACGLSKYRVTVSTVGIVPMMDKLFKASDASLAVSLHAPNDEIREKLIPMNQHYPIADIMAACKRFFKDKKRKVIIEYVMLDKINDQKKHAKELVRLLEGVPCKVNLIPFNTSPGFSYQPSSDEVVRDFQDVLMKAGVRTLQRKRRGADIQAACGQLVGNG
ncbi:MAG: 23S rRNA (adenine(2503)-C(2))-methyltransferase [Gammaproteobacteria bacterium RIFCSPHIGHO2_02_FULL_42_13]|nr:MAG: 23S rRNA (adenine(2503)-C(2))-methyltransferase [Gammaproteobacteria bacterium RIFCSPHIGHO2_02_FULL_42_13]OGT70202.1 MAG: 23S rRNA (adenine(2503)-C(2))-methyltransferase [Gammaproteobacteria bacterium RIFCSPLOWO2_02_FULL_42_9]